MVDSLRNRVQLLGYICKKPKNFRYRGQPYVRLLIEVDEVDDKGQHFSSYHPVIVPEEVAGNERDGPVCHGDRVMIEGRLNNYNGEKPGDVNVQAFALLVLRRAADVARSLVRHDISEEEKERLDKAYKIAVSGNVVSLRMVDNEDDELPF